MGEGVPVGSTDGSPAGQQLPEWQPRLGTWLLWGRTVYPFPPVRPPFLFSTACLFRCAIGARKHPLAKSVSGGHAVSRRSRRRWRGPGRGPARRFGAHRFGGRSVQPVAEVTADDLGQQGDL